MTWEPRPLPVVTPETREFWGATTDNELRLCHCQDCGLTYYYPRARCPDCLSDEVESIEATGHGVVYSYTVTETVSDWPSDTLPLVVAYVELEEGPRLLTNLVHCNPEKAEIGIEVEVTFIETDNADIAIPVFEPR